MLNPVNKEDRMEGSAKRDELEGGKEEERNPAMQSAWSPDELLLGEAQREVSATTKKGAVAVNSCQRKAGVSKRSCHPSWCGAEWKQNG